MSLKDRQSVEDANIKLAVLLLKMFNNIPNKLMFSYKGNTQSG